MFSISFICRSSKVNKMGLAPVECSIIYGKKRTFIQLPRREKPEDFKRLMAGRSNDLKSFCLAYHSKVQAAFSELFVRGVSPSIVKLCAGHSSIKLTTSTYMHLTSHDVVKGIINSAALG